jgi:hypothetical protein
MEINPQGPVYIGPWAIVACDREFLAADRSTGTLYASSADHGDACGGESGSAWELSFLACRANGFSSAILTDCGRRYISSAMIMDRRGQAGFRRTRRITR